MPGSARSFRDTAGGTILSVYNNSVYVNGLPGAVLLTPVAGHGKNKHAGPIMVGCSNTVRFSGMPACKQGDNATCGHNASGSSDVFIG